MLEPHRAQAVAAVRRLAGAAVDAEDCVHDAMVRLVPRDDLDPERVRALLVRTATHIAIDRLRAQRRAQRAVARLAIDAETRVVSPEEMVTDREQVHRVLAAVDRLPARERQVMRMRLAGLSIAEMSKLLGLSTKSVEGATTRARARIRLMVGGAVAWLVERMRRASSPRGEAFAAVVAVLLFAGPLWHHASDGPAAMARPAATHDGAPAAGDAPTGATLAASVSVGHRGGTAPGGEGQDTGHGNGGLGDGRHLEFSTGPINVPNPVDPQAPPLIWVGPLQVWQQGPSGLDAIQQCLAQGGPRISVSNGGC